MWQMLHGIPILLFIYLFIYLFCCHFQGSGNLDAIQIIKKLGGNLVDSYLDEGIISLRDLFQKIYM